MTLLVVSLEIPDLGSKNVDEHLRDFLDREWGQMLGFVLSFYVLAKFWMAHHRLFRSVRFASPRLMGAARSTPTHSRCAATRSPTPRCSRRSS